MAWLTLRSDAKVHLNSIVHKVLFREELTNMRKIYDADERRHSVPTV